MEGSINEMCTRNLPENPKGFAVNDIVNVERRMGLNENKQGERWQGDHDYSLPFDSNVHIYLDQ